jgi:hypothetical protein
MLGGGLDSSLGEHVADFSSVPQILDEIKQSGKSWQKIEQKRLCEERRVWRLLFTKPQNRNDLGEKRDYKRVHLRVRL